MPIPPTSPDTDTETNNFIELNTLPRSQRRQKKSQKGSPAYNVKRHSLYSSEMSTQQKKPGLKERLFGTRKNSGKGSSPKVDVVRNVEVKSYIPKLDRNGKTLQGNEIRKESSPQGRKIMGHLMETHKKSTWCDICEEFVWGLYAQALRCQYCKYTCHSRCAPYVDLDCPKAPTVEKTREDITRETLEILSETDGGYGKNKKNNNLPDFVSSIMELRKIISDYNTKNTLIMTLHDDSSFDGFIRVQMNLSRPVNMSADTSNLTLKRAVMRTKSGRSKRPLSESRRPLTEVFTTSKDFLSESEDSGIESQSGSSTLTSTESAKLGFSNKRTSRRLSFYLPKGTYKPLHVTSETTAKEVIEALLAKYSVTDNPKKYALYEKHEKREEGKEKEVVYRRLQGEDKPLVLLLGWEINNEKKTFALKEDDDGLIQWMNFELPELNNFLKILQMEEDESLAQIYQKFEQYRADLERAIKYKNETEGGWSSEC